MLRKHSLTVILLTVIVTLLLALNLKTTQAQDTANFYGVLPFYMESGRLGFFDQKDGSIYMYSRGFTELTDQFKLEKLGKPLVNMTPSREAPDFKYQGKTIN